MSSSGQVFVELAGHLRESETDRTEEVRTERSRHTHKEIDRHETLGVTICPLRDRCSLNLPRDTRQDGTGQDRHTNRETDIPYSAPLHVLFGTGVR